MDDKMFEVPSEEEWKEAHATVRSLTRVKGTELVPSGTADIEYLLENNESGVCLLPTVDTYAKVYDYLFLQVFRNHKSIQEMIMEDSCAMTVDEMKYFDGRFFGKMPSYGYFQAYVRSLPKEIRDELILTEKEILKNRYVKEMVSMAEMGMTDKESGRLFGYWHKLHSIADKEAARIESRVTKREVRAEANVDKGINAAAKMLKALSDEGLIELKNRVQELVDGRDREIS